MAYELSLQATFAVSLWILIDLVGSRGPRSRRWPMMWLAVSIIIWALGELLVANAQSPEGVTAARRVVFAGVVSTPLAWLWTAGALAPPPWPAQRRWLIPVFAVPLLFGYSMLFWDSGVLFVDWTARPSRWGPAMYPFAIVAWTALVLGGWQLYQGARRLGRDHPVRLAMIVFAAGFPLATSALYVLVGMGWNDPTPFAMGLSAVALRLAVLDSGVAAVLPMSQRAVFDQLDLAVVIADPAGVVVDANAGARRLLRPHLVGGSIDTLIEDARGDPGRSIFVEEAELRTPFGRAGRVALFTDRTEAERIAVELRERQKLESVGILAAGVAHDFNNLLTGILANVATARDTLEAEAPARAPLDEVRTGAELASNLTAQLLTYAGKRRMHPQPVDIDAAARDLLPLLERALPDAVELVYELDGELPAVEVDPGEIRQVLLNLVNNAADSIESSGRVTLRTRVTDSDDPADAGSGDPGRWVVVEVSDTGCGMNADTMEHIFEPFFTTKSNGHGLGLAATLGIVHGCYGRINVESNPGVGSTLRVELPASERHAAKPPEHARSGATVLAVDDEEYILDAIYHSLHRMGHEVLVASSGLRAVEMFRARSDQIDVVLLDLNMPGISGVEALHALRAIRKDVAVILSTGFDDIAEDLAGDPYTSFLPKPYDPDALSAAIEARLG